MRDEINLTRRMLEPLHKFHRLAAEYLVQSEYYSSSSLPQRRFDMK